MARLIIILIIIIVVLSIIKSIAVKFFPDRPVNVRKVKKGNSGSKTHDERENIVDAKYEEIK